MTISAAEIYRATGVTVTDNVLVVDLEDGRSISAPIGWFPRLSHATADERRDYRFIGGGEGIHWPQLDEDISIQNLLRGHGSGESNDSLAKWLDKRQSSNGAETPDEINRNRIAEWVLEALRSLDGSATVHEITKKVRELHGRELQNNPKAQESWQYELRWAGDILRKRGVLKPAKSSKKRRWELAKHG